MKKRNVESSGLLSSIEYIVYNEEEGEEGGKAAKPRPKRRSRDQSGEAATKAATKFTTHHIIYDNKLHHI